MDEKKVAAIFLLAGIEVQRLYRIENCYWPNVEAYREIRRDSPWWLVKTPTGLVKIGWRKRVIAIDWSDTGVSANVTEDDVTKDLSSVHAWSYSRAVQYLAVLAAEFKKPTSQPQPSGD